MQRLGGEEGCNRGGSGGTQCYARLVGDYSAAAVEKKSGMAGLALFGCTALPSRTAKRIGHEFAARNAIIRRAGRRSPYGPRYLRLLARPASRRLRRRPGPRSLAACQRFWRQLERATTERPFGEAAAMQAAAKKLTEAAGQLAIDAAQTRYDHSALSAALQFLTDPAHDTANDFSTARQAAWAIRGIASDAGLSDAELLFMRGPDDPLALTLPSGPDRSVMKNLNRWLRAAATYDAAWFREELRAARERMSGR